MKINGSAVLHAPPARVWTAITDPAVLARVIPGCDELTPVGDGRFGLSITLGVAAIKGGYRGEIAFSDMREPEYLTMRATGSGSPGTIDTTVAVRLTEVPDGTRVDYDADAMVGGMVGGVGQRVLAGVAKKTAGLFFAAIDADLAGVAVPVPAGVPIPAGPPVAGTVPAVASWTAQQRPARALAAAAAAAVGAAAALVGVLVGVAIGRRR